MLKVTNSSGRSLLFLSGDAALMLPTEFWAKSIITIKILPLDDDGEKYLYAFSSLKYL